MYVAITSAGTFRTDDGGATCMPLKQNHCGVYRSDDHGDSWDLAHIAGGQG
jgi:hypothetical protein